MCIRDRMKILLQSKGTRNYVERGGGWTWKQGRARVFPNGLDAIMFCLNGHDRDMQMTCVSRDLAKNFSVSVTDATGASGFQVRAVSPVLETNKNRPSMVKLMKKNLSQSGEQEPDSVNIYKEGTLQLWTRKFGCTKEQLQQAVQRVGASPGAVRAELGRRVPLRSK